MSQSNAPDDSVRSLLSRAGIAEKFQIERIEAGGNNRVFKLILEDGNLCLLKEYFSDSADPRNRLRTEYAFLSFLHRHGVSGIPEPLSCSYEKNLGLYRFIPGRILSPDEVTEERINELVAFFSAINRLRTLPDAADLPDASDACFSLKEHLDHIQGRVDRLSFIDTCSDIDRRAGAFIRETLVPAWDTLLAQMYRTDGGGVSFSTILADEKRVLSPSDFGFHNTILSDNGTLAFIDFEYAGWDDPLKTICDLFCQPKIPIDIRYFLPVAESILAITGDDREKWMNRVRMLFPAYRIKWCCILLNEFLPVGEKRRRFANPDERQEIKKTAQLAKAKKLLEDYHSP